MLVRGLFQFIGICLIIISPPTLANTIWQDVKPVAKKGFNAKIESHRKARILQLDRMKMALALDAMANNNLARRFATVESSANIPLPMPNGEMIEVELVRENLLEKSLRRSFPKMKTYRILPSAKIASGRLDMTPAGFHGILQTSTGKTIFIDPKKQTENTYISYYKNDQVQTSGRKFTCGASSANPLDSMYIAAKASSSVQEKSTRNHLINYRIAIAATGEYTAKHGGTVEGALSAIVTTINRVNQVFEQNLGIHLTLVANNDQIIYTDAASDPFYAEDEDELILQNQDNLDDVIGSSNYDIGHLFTSNGGGLAAIAGVCNNHRKAQGISGITDPENDSFNLDFVAHELGHQLGATHTFNGIQGLCSGQTRASETAFEPGSGSSIMSYAGYCGADNLQSNVDAMFHIRSIEQIRSFAQTSRGSCGTKIETNNQPPVVNAGVDYVIPANTPFELKGSATDSDSDNLTYSWEQLDAGKRTIINEDSGDNSLFRIYMPSTSASRNFPSITALLKHQTIRGEKLPEKSRKLHFSFVARDNNNPPQSDEMTIDVKKTSTHFGLYLPHYQYNRGETHKILWSVAETDIAPINCQNVDISLSTDGGYSFPQLLAKSVPNTGESWITIPATTLLTTDGRYKVKCSDNIFYAVSYRNFEIMNQDSDGETLADQDKPEPKLDESKINHSANNLVSNAVSTGNGGGSFDWFYLLLILAIGFSRKLALSANS